MIKPRFTKHLCMLLTLLLLLAPAAALAEAIRIGDQPKCSVTVSNDSLDTGGELFINGISYEAQLNPKGDIVVRNADLTAAKRAAEAIADYEASLPGKSFDSLENMKIISGYGLKVLRSELPDPKTAATEIESMEFPEELSDDSSQRLGQALTAFQQTLSSTSNDEVNYDEKILTILQLFSVSDTRFNENMTDVYLLLYDIRAAIARGTFPQSILTEETTTNLLAIFRDILEKGGVDLDEIEFWESDEDWVCYAAKESKSKLAAGDKIAISDKAGKSIMVSVTVPAAPEPPSPDEYVFEPPPPQDLPEIPDGYNEQLTIESETVEQDDVEKLVVNEYCFILFSVSCALEGATYEWQCTDLPDYLEFAVNNDDSSEASIYGTPTTVNTSGTNVTVSASTSYCGINYDGSLSFKIIVNKPMEKRALVAPQAVSPIVPVAPSGTVAPATPTDTVAPVTPTDTIDPATPTDTAGTVDPSTPTDTAGTTGTTDTDDYVDPTDTTDPSTPSTLTTPVDPETPELPES